MSCVYLDAYMMCVSQQVNVRQLVEAEILTCIEQLQHSVASYIETCYVQVNPFQTSSAFQIETSHLFTCAKKKTEKEKKNIDWFVFEMEKWIEILKSRIYPSNYSQPFALAISENFLLPIKKDTPENFPIMHWKENP